MSKITKPICGCNQMMRPHKTGVTLLIRDAQSKYTCKVQADEWICPYCHKKIFSGFGETIEPFDPVYEALTDIYMECTF